MPTYPAKCTIQLDCQKSSNLKTNTWARLMGLHTIRASMVALVCCITAHKPDQAMMP